MALEKKKIFDIEIPLMGQSIQALSTVKENLNGKIIKLDLTRVLKGRNIDSTLLVSMKDGKLVADFTGLKVVPSYIRRMMRKNISWIEDSFICPTKDAKVEVKPFMITKKRVHRSVRKELRNNAKEIIVKFAADKTAEQVFDATIRGTLQKDISAGLKKIYPLAFCEIRILKLKK